MFFFTLFVAGFALLISLTLIRPQLVYEYPYFMAATFTAFILPQAYALYLNGWGELYLEPTLLMCFLYWQLIPVLMASMGSSLEIKKLLVYPIPRGKLLEDQYLPPVVPTGLPSALLERRPDVKGAEDLLLATNADIGAAKALFFPNFSLTGALGSASHELSNLADRRAAIWSVAGGILQPVFQGWRIFYNYEATKARFDQALAQYQKAAQNGFRDVADALVSIEKLKDIRAELETSVTSLSNAARLSRLRYDTGLANYLEILIADQQLFDQELLLARAKGSQLTAVVQLYRALGGGWQP